MCPQTTFHSREALWRIPSCYSPFLALFSRRWSSINTSFCSLVWNKRSSDMTRKRTRFETQRNLSIPLTATHVCIHVLTHSHDRTRRQIRTTPTGWSRIYLSLAFVFNLFLLVNVNRWKCFLKPFTLRVSPGVPVKSTWIIFIGTWLFVLSRCYTISWRLSKHRFPLFFLFFLCHYLFPEGTGRTTIALFKCFVLNLQVRVDMWQRCIGCLAEWRPITQHYVAMTKQETENSDLLQSRRAHPPAFQ